MSGCQNPGEPTVKSAAARLNYKYDLSGYLTPGDLVEDGTFTLYSTPPGLIFESPVLAGDRQSVSVFILGGETYQDYQAVLKFSTDGGLDDERSIWLRIQPT